MRTWKVADSVTFLTKSDSRRLRVNLGSVDLSRRSQVHLLKRPTSKSNPKNDPKVVHHLHHEIDSGCGVPLQSRASNMSKSRTAFHYNRSEHSCFPPSSLSQRCENGKPQATKMFSIPLPLVGLLARRWRAFFTSSQHAALAEETLFPEAHTHTKFALELGLSLPKSLTRV